MVDYLSPLLITPQNMVIAETTRPLNHCTKNGMATVEPHWSGYVACIAAGILYGSNFVPVKKYNTGDGLFFQWIMASGIWMTGFMVYVIRAGQADWVFPTFEPFALLGGFLWCTGNIFAVPIIQCIGLGVGLFLWSTSSLLLGWLTGTLGLFGIPKTVIYVPWLNYLGAGLALASGVAFALIKPNNENEEEEEYKETNSLESIQFIENNTLGFAPVVEKSWVQTLGTTQQRILGVVLSIISGALYGTNLTPPEYVMNHCDNKCSQNGLDYVFTHFSGIFITSTLYFLLYVMVKKNQPYINPEIALPGFVSGVMWAGAQTLALFATPLLGFSVSFPIFSTIPGLVGSLWGILVFKEISGLRNYMWFLVAALLVSGSVVSVSLSSTNTTIINNTNATLFYFPVMTNGSIPVKY
eukprot:TRINITY_DN10339_c0_g1_i1.p1 TRINITY_DN10339_c0_g1~~TRINITY_DN10339_c0_g1_i1.p1  ORF type:complete len:411 (-),score=79.90 TRINITY_DN10339_c0_g1_i1:26-1258(-)